MSKLKQEAEKLFSDYLKALDHANGAGFSKTFSLSYVNGWVLIRNSVSMFSTSKVRVSQFKEMIETLNKRKPFTNNNV